jgi:hypothetical protein
MRPERVPETTQHTKEIRMKADIMSIGLERDREYVARVFETVQRSFNKLRQCCDNFS